MIVDKTLKKNTRIFVLGLVNIWNKIDKRDGWDGIVFAIDREIDPGLSKTACCMARKELYDKGYVGFRVRGKGHRTEYWFPIERPDLVSDNPRQRKK